VLPKCSIAAPLLVLVMSSAPSSARAQSVVEVTTHGDLVEIEDPAVRLETWLTADAHSAVSARTMLGVISTTAGIGLGGYAVANLALRGDELSGEDGGFLIGMSLLSAVVGLAAIGQGIAVLATPSPAERRYARWRELRARGAPDGDDIARFEGELFQEMEAVRHQRPLSFGLGLGLAAGGGLALALTAAYAREPVDQVTWYSVGGAASFAGLLLAALVWIDSPEEQRWRAYEDGFAPDSVRLEPIVSPEVVGLGASGAF
jgi:hypothetical protein